MSKDEAIRLHQEANDLWEQGDYEGARDRQLRAVEKENELGKDDREAVAAAVNGEPAKADGAEAGAVR